MFGFWDIQQLQYYTTDTADMNEAAVNDGYQQYQTESTLQVQPKQDEYYTVSPGENYYTDYENVNDNRTYAAPSNATNLQAVDVPVVEQHHQQQKRQPPPQPQQQQQPQPQSNQQTQPEPIYVPNYLQSDTDDSQIGYQNQPANNPPQSQDSDFDFSTNS